MSSVSLAVVAKLRAELRFVMDRTLALAASVQFLRRRDHAGRLVARLDPSPRQVAEAGKVHERFLRWHGITKSLLRRYALTPVINLDHEVQKGAVYVLLQRATCPDIPAGRWRAAFDRELTEIVLKLEEVLDLCESAIPPASLPALYEPVDVSIDMGRDPGITVNELNAVMDACTKGKATVTMLARLGTKLFSFLGEDVYGSGRWIRLHLENAGFLANAPWEALHDGKEFLAVQPSIAISRSLPREPAGLPAQEPLRLLVMISSPSDSRGLRVEEEAQLLRDALGGLELIGLAEVDIVTDGSLDTMRRKLRAAEERGRPYNAWHFIGHGRFNAAGRSELAMTGDGGTTRFIDAAQFRTLFHGHPLRLVVINACESGAFDCGAAAVVAMQFPISDDAAIVLADEVYGAFGTGAGILSAMTGVRRALFCRPPGIEWITPVLFLEEQSP
jgi:hypothetical protein